jgi:hypothetical protein
LQNRCNGERPVARRPALVRPLVPRHRRLRAGRSGVPGGRRRFHNPHGPRLRPSSNAGHDSCASAGYFSTRSAMICGSATVARSYPPLLRCPVRLPTGRGVVMSGRAIDGHIDSDLSHFQSFEQTSIAFPIRVANKAAATGALCNSRHRGRSLGPTGAKTQHLR